VVSEGLYHLRLPAPPHDIPATEFELLEPSLQGSFLGPLRAWLRDRAMVVQRRLRWAGLDAVDDLLDHLVHLAHLRPGLWHPDQAAVRHAGQLCHGLEVVAPLQPRVDDDGEPLLVRDVWLHPIQELLLALWPVPVNGPAAGDELVQQNAIAPYITLCSEASSLHVLRRCIP